MFVLDLSHQTLLKDPKQSTKSTTSENLFSVHQNHLEPLSPSVRSVNTEWTSESLMDYIS